MKLWRQIIAWLGDLIGNRVTEKDIRDWLETQGYRGDSARFTEIELHAIAPPGWRQLFRFSGNVANGEGERRPMFGVVEDDERYGKTEIAIYSTAVEQHAHLNRIADQYPIRRRSR